MEQTIVHRHHGSPDLNVHKKSKAKLKKVTVNLPNKKNEEEEEYKTDSSIMEEKTEEKKEEKVETPVTRERSHSREKRELKDSKGEVTLSESQQKIQSNGVKHTDTIYDKVTALLKEEYQVYMEKIETQKKRYKEMKHKVKECQEIITKQEHKNSEIKEKLEQSEKLHSRLRGEGVADLQLKELESLLRLHQEAIIRLRTSISNVKEQEKMCAICYEHPKDTMILPCGHFKLCEACSKHNEIKECPFCKTAIESYHRVYT